MEKYIVRYISTNEHFEYGYPHSSAPQCLPLKALFRLKFECCQSIKLYVIQQKVT